MMLLANGVNATTAVDGDSGLGLTAYPVGDVSSRTVRRLHNSAPTTVGIPDITVLEPTQPVKIPLSASFADVEDTFSKLKYSTIANSNASLFNAVGLDPESGMMTLLFRPSAFGTSKISVKATDTGGKSVEAEFSVNVSPLSTYSQFAGFAFGGNEPNTGPLAFARGDGLRNQLKYAFHVLKPADFLGAPHLSKVGNSKILTYRRPKYSTDIAYFHEVSSDLLSWTTALDNVDCFRGESDLGDGSVKVDLLLLRGEGFVRVKSVLSAAPSMFEAGARKSAVVSDSKVLEAVVGEAVAPWPAFPSEIIISDPEHPPAQSQPVFVAGGDFDGDGNADVLVGSRGDGHVSWYKGSGGVNGFGPERSVATIGGFIEAVRASDVDGDGRLDVVAVSNRQNSQGSFTWCRNLGGGSFAPAALMVPVSSSTDGACAVAIGDLDGNGTMDLICASRYSFDPVFGPTLRASHRFAWYPRLSDGTYGPEQEIPSPPASTSDVLIHDFDHDGLVDIAAASFNHGALFIYRQSPVGVFTRSTIYSDATNLRINDLALGDLDGDGWMDIVSAATFGALVRYSRNNHDNTFTTTDVANATVNPVYAVECGDFDQDGRTDVCAAMGLRLGLGSGSRLVWYRNLGGGSFGEPTSNQVIISANGVDAFGLGVADFNNDSASDLVCGWFSSDRVTAYLNSNGGGASKVAFSSMPVGSGPVFDGMASVILSVNVSNQSGAGGSAGKLSKLGLLVEKAPGVPMTSLEANDLIESLHLYADSNDSGLFEPGVDKEVAATYYLGLEAGKLLLSLTYADPQVTLLPQRSSRRFFVASEMKGSASRQTPNGFRITHVGQGVGRSVVVDVASGAPLVADPANADTPSAFVTAVVRPSLVAGSIPNVTVFDTTGGKEVALGQYFSSGDGGVGEFELAVVGNSNPTLLDAVGVDRVARKLAMVFKAGVAGSTVLTVRAKDSFGNTASASFQVTVALVKNFSEWAQMFYGDGASGAGNCANLGSYAFGLNPLTNDVSGLPRLEKSGAVWLLRHRKQKWSTDLTYSYEFSSDLVSWKGGVSGVDYYEFTTPLADGLLQSDVVLLGKEPRFFVRPRVSVSP